MKPLLLLLCLCGFGGLPLAAQDFPITRVALYTSGVAFFEHSATVRGEVSLNLAFREPQMNDLLKSLILRDAAGASPSAEYPSQDPDQRILTSFALDLTGSGGLAALLPQLRGVEVILTTPTEIRGRVVGLDTVDNKDKPETLITLATATGLRVLPLASVSQLSLVDPRLNQELTNALNQLASQRDGRKKTVLLRFPGTESRTISAGYILEAPVWKTSYRLDLTGKAPFLQGWAMIENTTETDWNKVQLSLVAGRPVSFIQDLYTAQYVQRPLYVPETEAGPAPRLHASGLAQKSLAAPAPAPSAALSKESVDEDAMSSLIGAPRPVTQGQAAGELFQFTFAQPVTLARRQSALVPMVAQTITAEKVSLFQTETDQTHPQNAVWMTNTGSTPLPAGPITLYDGGTYAGDAITSTVLPGDRRLWTYATDLALTIDSQSQSDQVTTRIRWVNGNLSLSKKQTWNRLYRLANKATEAKLVLLEEPRSPERTLRQPDQAAELTPELQRFRVNCPPGVTTEFRVIEEQILTETQAIGSQDSEQILAYVREGGPMSNATKAALERAAELQAQVARRQREAAALSQQKTDLLAGQSRLRDNLQAVGRESALGQSYVKRLAESDGKIDGLEAQILQLRQAIGQAQMDLADYLKNLTLD